MTTECRRSKIFQWAEKRFCTCVSAATGAAAVSASLKKTLFSLATTVLPADLSLQLLPRSVIRFLLPGSERNIMYPAQLPCATSSALVPGLRSFPRFFLWTSSRVTLAVRSITALPCLPLVRCLQNSAKNGGACFSYTSSVSRALCSPSAVCFITVSSFSSIELSMTSICFRQELSPLSLSGKKN